MIQRTWFIIFSNLLLSDLYLLMTRNFSQSSLNLDTVLREIKTGKVRPCYLFWGEEEFLVMRAVRMVTESLVPPESRVFNVVEVDGSKVDLQQVLAEMHQPSLLPGRKVVVVKKASPLFRERVSPGSLVKRIVEDLEEEPVRAVRYFLRLLVAAGIPVETLKEKGLKVIPESWWSELRYWPEDKKREWLGKILALYEEYDLPVANDGNEVDLFIESLGRATTDVFVVIMSAETVDTTSKLYRAFVDTGVILTFSRGKSESEKMGMIRGLCESLLRREGKTMDDDAWRALGERTGYDPGVSMKEVEKLILYVGEKKWITTRDVESIPSITRDDNIFDLTVALLGGDETRAITILNNLLDRGEAILRILGGITREVRSILHARVILESGILEGFHAQTPYKAFHREFYPRIKELSSLEASFEPLKQHPFGVYRTLGNAYRFSKGQLIEVLERLADIDIQLKTTTTEGRFIVERFVMSFSRLLKVCSTIS